MKLFGLVMVKNEEDIIETTLRHFLAEGLDEIVVVDNISRDKTPQILQKLDEEFPGRLNIVADEEFAYYQERKMNGWISQFCQEADWIIPFDADEIWFDNNGKTLKEFFENINPQYGVVECPVYDMIPDVYTRSETPVKDIIWRNPMPEMFPVVAFKNDGFVRLHAGNHGVDHLGMRLYGGLSVCHFQYRSFHQYSNKLMNGKDVYDATNLDVGFGAHWREGGALSKEELWSRWIEYCTASPRELNPCPARGQL